MARPGVTYIEVANAAEVIQGLGQNPTVDRVLSQLGTGAKAPSRRYSNNGKRTSDKVLPL